MEPQPSRSDVKEQHQPSFHQARHQQKRTAGSPRVLPSLSRPMPDDGHGSSPYPALSSISLHAIRRKQRRHDKFNVDVHGLQKHAGNQLRNDAATTNDDESDELVIISPYLLYLLIMNFIITNFII